MRLAIGRLEQDELTIHALKGGLDFSASDIRPDPRDGLGCTDDDGGESQEGAKERFHRLKSERVSEGILRSSVSSPPLWG